VKDTNSIVPNVSPIIIERVSLCLLIFLQYAIRKVLSKTDLEKKFVVEGSLKESKTLLSTFRTEERRRVSSLGLCTHNCSTLPSHTYMYYMGCHKL